MPERMDDLPILTELGDALDAAFRLQEDPAAAPTPARRRHRGRRLVVPGRLRGLPVIVLLTLGLGASAATAALLALRATVIPAPATRDLSPTMRAIPGTGRIGAVTAADPGGGPRWAVRTTRSQTGLTCSTVGQLVDGEFGIVGLDGRFRRLPERIVDGCGAAVKDRATLLGVRIFDAARPREVRSVLSGVAGPALRSVELQTVTGRRRLAVDGAGRFVVALRGYPEDSAPLVVLRFADGAVQRRRFGLLPGVVRDPGGGPALSGDLVRFSDDDDKVCVRVIGLRSGVDAPIGPFACARRAPGAVLFMARRVRTGQTGEQFFAWHWGTAPARTIVWGWLRRPAPLTLLGAGAPRPVPVADDGTYVAILPAGVAPERLRLRVQPVGDGPPPVLAPGAGETAPPVLPGARGRGGRR